MPSFLCCSDEPSGHIGVAELHPPVRRVKSLPVTKSDSLNNLIVALAFKANVTQEQITEACIVGNTAMTHLLLKLPVHQLSVSPFVAASRSAVDVKARDLDLDIAPGAYVHVLPCVGGFVGAEIFARLAEAPFELEPV